MSYTPMTPKTPDSWSQLVLQYKTKRRCWLELFYMLIRFPSTHKKKRACVPCLFSWDHGLLSLHFSNPSFCVSRHACYYTSSRKRGCNKSRESAAPHRGHRSQRPDPKLHTLVGCRGLTAWLSAGDNRQAFLCGGIMFENMLFLTVFLHFSSQVKHCQEAGGLS